MRRDINIIPLSRDHHHSLLFCWKIRQGLAKGVVLERIRLYVNYFWSNHLEKHFQEEEELLFQDVHSDLCIRALEEHRRISKLIEIIGDTGAMVPENYHNLADLVESHIRFEERHLFPLLETTLSKERLSAIGAQLHGLPDHPVADHFGDAFWN